MTEFKADDVVRYTSERRDRWCREGTAIACGDDAILVDTFWGGYGSDSHVLTPDERATAEVLFNIADYDELDRYNHGSEGTWRKYAPGDRTVITSQHGLQRRWFVRKGAQPNLPTQIQNAREAVAQAEEKLSSAQWWLDSARRELAELEATAQPA